MAFFSHSEGYVKNVIDEDTGFGASNNIYRYVFNYTDHLGNVRLSYTKDPITNVLTILEENNYYPFGLKHRNYNMNKKDYEKLVTTGGIAITPTNETIYDYKFQGQEYQDELGLSWYSFKWRNYDPTIARFFNIDPLSEKYAYQSHYNFSENRVIDGVELEGLEVVLVNKEKDPLIHNVGNSNKDKSAIHVYAHGGQRSIVDNRESEDKGSVINTKTSFKNLISNSSESEQWENRSSENPAVVVLHSCRTGRTITKDGEKIKDSFAEKISEIENTIIVAPDERDVFTDYFLFSTESGPYKYSNTDENGNYLEYDSKNKPANSQKTERGEWIIYKGGEEVGRKPGSWEPNGDEIKNEYGKM